MRGLCGIARRVGRERRRTLRRDRHEFGELSKWDVVAAADGHAYVRDRDQLELVLRRVAELEERERLAIHAYYLQERERGKLPNCWGCRGADSMHCSSGLLPGWRSRANHASRAKRKGEESRWPA